MSLVFPDVNVWIVLSIEHVHQEIALDWWREEPGPIAFCRFTQIGLLRLLTTSAAMDGKPLTMKQAWTTFDVFAGDERTEFVPEPPSVEQAFRGLSSSGHASPKVWADAYLTAFAGACGGSIVTFDKALARQAKHCLLLT
jgi:toxin-antitoxin system PIN domain toxin